MNIQQERDKRQPWHLIAKVDGGNQLVDVGSYQRLMARVRRPVSRPVRELVEA